MSKRLPTLKELTGQRPVCQWCNQELKPDTHWFILPGHFDHPPTVDDIEAIKQDKLERGFSPSLLPGVEYSPDNAFRLTVVKNVFDSKPETKISFWSGHYNGAGHRRGLPHPLFCNKDCGTYFGSASWAGGYRRAK